MGFSDKEAFLAACRNNGNAVMGAIEAAADQGVIDDIEVALGFAEERVRKIEQAQKLLEEAGETMLASTVAAKLDAKPALPTK